MGREDKLRCRTILAEMYPEERVTHILETADGSCSQSVMFTAEQQQGHSTGRHDQIMKALRGKDNGEPVEIVERGGTWSDLCFEKLFLAAMRQVRYKEIIPEEGGPGRRLGRHTEQRRRIRTYGPAIH